MTSKLHPCVFTVVGDRGLPGRPGLPSTILPVAGEKGDSGDPGRNGIPGFTGPRGNTTSYCLCLNVHHKCYCHNVTIKILNNTNCSG